MAIVDQDKLRVGANFELGGGHLYQNVYYYIRDGNDPFSDAAHIAAIKTDLDNAYARIATWIRSDVTPQLSTVDRIEWVTTKWEITENIGTFTPALTPLGTGDGLPFQCSPYVTFKTLRPRTVGKKFLFPFTEAAQDDSVLLAAVLTAVGLYASDILSSISLGGDATLTTGVPRTGVNSWFNFLVAVVPDIVGTQRRRKIGVGA